MLLRAFCSDTSVPKTGASGVRTMPRICPVVSTTEIVTSALLPSGRRICAARRERDAERLGEQRRDLGGAQRDRALAAGLRREAIDAAGRGQDEGAVVVEQVVGVGPDAGSAEARTRCRRAARHCRNSRSRPGTPGGRQVDRGRVGRAVSRSRRRDSRSAGCGRRPRPGRRGGRAGAANPTLPATRDQLVEIVVAVADVAVEAVDAVGDHADAADQRAVLVERQAAGIGREAERRALGADPRVDRAARCRRRTGPTDPSRAAG